MAEIKDYSFGNIEVDGKTYTSDIKIVGGQVVSDWWRIQGHVLDGPDVTDILSVRPEILVVGRGSPGLMVVSPQLRDELAKLRIELIDEPTATAVSIFNKLSKSGKNVAGAFHLTC